MMPEIDVYDFDHTLFRGDTYTVFLLYLFRRRPWLAPLSVFTLLGLLLMALIPWDMRPGKTVAFLPLRLARAWRYAGDFWAEMQAQGRIAPWFRPAENDVPTVVCTATPRFLVEPLFTGRLAIHTLIATELDPRTLRFTGRNNRGPEKVRRLRALFPGARVRIAASDSLRHDKPLLRLARQPMLVKDFTRQTLRPEDL